MKQNCTNCSTELSGKHRQIIACAVCFEDNHLNEAPTMSTYYRNEFNKIDPAEPATVIVSGINGKTKTINLNPESIRELRELLDRIEVAMEDNTIYKTGDAEE